MRIEKEYIKFINYSLETSVYPETKVEFTLDCNSNLPQILEQFENSLRSIGYSVKGKLEIVEEEPVTKNDYEGEF